MSRLNFLLLLVVVICALSVVNATNRQRELFISLGRAQMQERQLQQDLAQLQYQQSSLSKTSRVEDTATSELKMEGVTAGRTQYLTVAGASAAAAGDATGAGNSSGTQGVSGAMASDSGALNQGSGAMPAASANDDTSNPATNSDLRAVIGASTPVRAASKAASGAAPASAPANAAAADKAAGKSGAKPGKGAAKGTEKTGSKNATKHPNKGADANGVSK